MIVIDFPGGIETSAKTKLPFQNQEGAGAQPDASIISGLCHVPVHSGDSRLVNADDPIHKIEIGEDECDLLRRPKPREEPELIVVSLSLAPVAMKGCDQCLGIVHGKGIDLRSLGFPQASTMEILGRIFMKRPVPIPEIEGALQNTDDIVIRLLAPAMSVGDRDQLRVADSRKDKMPDPWAPDAIEDLSIRPYCGSCHILAPETGFAVGEIVVKDISAQSGFRSAGQASEKPIVWKLLFEGEDA